MFKVNKSKWSIWFLYILFDCYLFRFIDKIVALSMGALPTVDVSTRNDPAFKAAEAVAIKNLTDQAKAIYPFFKPAAPSSVLAAASDGNAGEEDDEEEEDEWFPCGPAFWWGTAFRPINVNRLRSIA